MILGLANILRICGWFARSSVNLPCAAKSVHFELPSAKLNEHIMIISKFLNFVGKNVSLSPFEKISCKLLGLSKRPKLFCTPLQALLS